MLHVSNISHKYQGSLVVSPVTISKCLHKGIPLFDNFTVPLQFLFQF